MKTKKFSGWPNKKINEIILLIVTKKRRIFSIIHQIVNVL